ncbi:MAG: HlyD family efflux transporter periplasmic adaptor subunit [Balneolaceae bacterium]
MIYPEEIIKSSSEAVFFKHSTRSRIIYLTVLVFLTGCALLLPYINVDIGVRSRGMIRPAFERLEIYSRVSGTVKNLSARENNRVDAGDILAVMETESVRELLQYNKRRIGQLKEYLSDLHLLSGNQTMGKDPDRILTARYRRSFHEYSLKTSQAERELERAKGKLDRSRVLAGKDHISGLELENARFLYTEAENRKELIDEQQIHRWLLEKNEFQEEKELLEIDVQKLDKKIEESVIRAPVSGSILNLAGIHRGSFIRENQIIAEISPDTELIAELYIRPENIGLIYTDMPVRLQIDAFNHNQWGVISGTVSEIADDTDLMENGPVFKVRCTIQHPYLELSSGYRGKLRKGMTLQARLLITERTLFQLLYDKVDNWLNPVWS